MPIIFSNNPEGAALGILVFVVIFFFTGYLLLTLLGNSPGNMRAVLSPIFGMVTITTAYDMCARASISIYFPYLAGVLAVGGMFFFIRQTVHTSTSPSRMLGRREAVIAGSAVTFAIAPLFWRSGRFSEGEFIFYGPAGQDQLFHVTMLQRLLQHIPPDNFMVSGLRASVYHYFDDLMLALILQAQKTLHLGTTNLFDLYYRCYPTFVYFLIGVLAYRAGRQLGGTARSGVLAILLLLGGGGLGWFFGALQTAVHASHFAAIQAAVFSPWNSWAGVDSILPLVHRPAYYNSLLICLAAINALLQPARCWRDWILAGLLFGLMAGFNFTLAATFGISAVLGSLALLWQHRQYEARELAGLALFIFIGSLPITMAMVFSGFHNPAPGFPFRGPNLEFPTSIWSGLLGRMMPSVLIPWTSLIVFPIVAFGVKLFGLSSMARIDMGGDRNRAMAMMLLIAFALSFVVGTFFPYQGLGGIGIIFLQPTLWILGLFSLRPIEAWLQRNRGSWRPMALWGMLGLTWIQALGAFNFSSKAVFDGDTLRALQDIRLQATPADVVAYLPTYLTEAPILGYAEVSTNFSVLAMTGLDGYFSSETYSKYSAIPGISAPNPAEALAQSERLYDQRRSDVESYVEDRLDAGGRARLAKDHVRWIVVSGNAPQSLPSTLIPWRKTREIAVYRLYP